MIDPSPSAELPTPNPPFDRAHYFRLGGSAAAVYLVVLVALYLIDRQLLLNPGLDYLIANVLYWTVIIKAISDHKIRHQFELTLGEGIKAGFTTALFLPLVFHLFMYLLFNFIDPEMIEVQMEVIKDSVATVAGLFGEGVSEAEFGDMEATLDAIGVNGYPFSAVVLGLAQSFFYLLLIALVVSLVKKTR